MWVEVEGRALYVLPSDELEVQTDRDLLSDRLDPNGFRRPGGDRGKDRANGDLARAGEYHLRNGAQRDAVGRDRERAGDVRVQAKRRNRSGRRDTNAIRHLHARRR